uniref:Uncharacterized protein n=1 Tax=Cannabis sativa TaxID=3483 RepID=A0A803PT41_CANSA
MGQGEKSTSEFLVLLTRCGPLEIVATFPSIGGGSRPGGFCFPGPKANMVTTARASGVGRLSESDTSSSLSRSIPREMGLYGCLYGCRWSVDNRSILCSRNKSCRGVEVPTLIGFSLVFPLTHSTKGLSSEASSSRSPNLTQRPLQVWEKQFSFYIKEAKAGLGWLLCILPSQVVLSSRRLLHDRIVSKGFN